MTTPDYSSQRFLVTCPVCGATSDQRTWPQDKLTNIDGLAQRLRTLEEAHANFVAGAFTRMSAVEHAMDEIVTGLRELQDQLRPFIHQASTKGS